MTEPRPLIQSAALEKFVSKCKSLPRNQDNFQ